MYIIIDWSNNENTLRRARNIRSALIIHNCSEDIFVAIMGQTPVTIQDTVT